ncbi:MAG: AIR synthase-related protein, partial [Bacteroidota bacterium]
GELVRSVLASGLARAAHDLSDGGLAVAAAEIALAAGCGVALEDPPEGFTSAEWWFGEDQGRYLLCVPVGRIPALLDAAGEAGRTAKQLGFLKEAAASGPGFSLSVAALTSSFTHWVWK